MLFHLCSVKDIKAGLLPCKLQCQDGNYLCELAFEANEVDLGGVSSKVAGNMEVYTVHPAELGNPVEHQLGIQPFHPTLYDSMHHPK